MMKGTGFVVGNGTLVATNAHVVPDKLDSAKGEILMVIVPSGRHGPQQHAAIPVSYTHLDVYKRQGSGYSQS